MDPAARPKRKAKDAPPLDAADLLACLSDAGASPAAEYRPAPAAELAAAAVALLAGPDVRHQISSDDDSESSKRRDAPSPPPAAQARRRPPPLLQLGQQQEQLARKDLRRERNREHARVSRERKRRRLQDLEEENAVLRKENGALTERVARLEARLGL